MRHLILLRHGQSEWNLKNLFTGWTDVDLTAQGRIEAVEAGKKSKKPASCRNTISHRT